MTNALTLFELCNGMVGESYYRSYVWCATQPEAILAFEKLYPGQKISSIRPMFSAAAKPFITRVADGDFGEAVLLDDLLPKPRRKPPRALWFGRKCCVPAVVAVCPECRGELAAEALQWDSKTGQPSASSIEIDCLKDLRNVQRETTHYGRQSDWQPVRDAVAKWCGASNH